MKINERESNQRVEYVQKDITMKCVNCIERGISVGNNHSVFDRGCQTYMLKKCV